MFTSWLQSPSFGLPSGCGAGHCSFEIRNLNSAMIQPWKKISSQATAKFRIFSVRTDRKVSPRTGAEQDFSIIDSGSRVNVIATASDHQHVMIEQCRSGANTVDLEIPGGVIDTKDA